MNFLILILFSLFFNNIPASRTDRRNIPELIDLEEVIKNTKRYWIDQFKFFEERGRFT